MGLTNIERGNLMKTVLAALVLSLGFIAVAEAACPVGTRYQCHPTYNGKMQCGCY